MGRIEGGKTIDLGTNDKKGGPRDDLAWSPGSIIVAPAVTEE